MAIERALGHADGIAHFSNNAGTLTATARWYRTSWVYLLSQTPRLVCFPLAGRFRSGEALHV
jgi:hypothetical protein